MLTLEPSDLAAPPSVRGTPGLVLRTLDLAQEIDLAVEAQVRARDASFEADGADPHDVAIGIYRAVGFTQVESHWCLQRRPLRDRR